MSRIEKLVMSIHVHGSSVIFEDKPLAILRWCYKRRRRAFYEIIWALQEEGMDRGDAMALVGKHKHDKDCACWACVKGLHARVAQETAQMRVRHG